MLRDLDHLVFHWINSHHNAALDVVFVSATWLCEYAVIWWTFALVALCLRDRKWKRAGLLFIVGTIVQLMLFNWVFKLVWFRPRPYAVLPDVRRLGLLWVNSSFPAGHATSAFLGARVFSHFHRRWRIPLFIFAAITAVSRVYVGMHYPSDALVGSVVGLLLAWVMLRLDARFDLYGWVRARLLIMRTIFGLSLRALFWK